MPFTSTQLFPQLLGSFHSRKLLLHSPLNNQSERSPPPSYNGHNSIDGDVVMVFSVLLCALVCSLGLNSLVRCMLRCSRSVSSASNGSFPARFVNTGVKQKDLKTFPVVECSTQMKLPGLDTDCVICLSEFEPGERLRLLPKCNHGFHVACIDKWLKSHSSCPKCRHCLIDKRKKMVKCSQVSSSESSMPVQETIASVAPLEPEGPIRDYRVSS